MKVAVLTLSLYANYGGTLQAYALLQALKNMGHDAWFLNRERHKVSFWKWPFVLSGRALEKYILRNNVKIGTGILDRRKRSIVSANFRKFFDKNIQPQTVEFLTSRDLARAFSALSFDAVVVGSDQVWRHRYVHHNISDYYFGFIPGWDTKTRRFSYAASFGTSDFDYPEEDKSSCKDLISKFDAVSVRESSGVAICAEHFGVAAEHVIDPTLLLSPADYVQLIPDPENNFSGILVYILDEDSEKQQLIDDVAKLLGLPVFRVNGAATNSSARLRDQIAPPVEDWLRGFRDASFVITDSFHGSVFSILFNKPFVAYGNQSRGMSRFSSLLEMFDLENRLITDPLEFSDDLLRHPDWSLVNSKLDIERDRAKEFIRRALAS